MNVEDINQLLAYHEVFGKLQPGEVQAVPQNAAALLHHASHSAGSVTIPKSECESLVGKEYDLIIV